MAGKLAAGAVMFIASLCGVALAQQQERTAPTRGFDQFELESETVDGFWAEAGALLQRTHKDESPVVGATEHFDVDATTAFARLAYGASGKWEGGLFIPYEDVSGHVTSSGVRSSLDENGIGDIQLSGKFVPLRSSLLDFGVGADLSLPSGDKDKGLGSGELGGTPFVTGAIHLSVADIRGHVGGEFFTGSDKNGLASDHLVYGFGIFVPLCKYAVLRNEFSAVNFYDLPGSPKVVTYFPGIDIRIPIGDYDLLIRPTGNVGISEQAPNWGVGGSIAITSPTMRAPVSKGGVTVE